MRAYRGHWKGKNFVSKLYYYCPWFLKRWILFSLSNQRAEYNWRAISRTLPSNLKLPLISEEIFNLSNLRVLPAKSKCKMPHTVREWIYNRHKLPSTFFTFPHSFIMGTTSICKKKWNFTEKFWKIWDFVKKKKFAMNFV